MLLMSINLTPILLQDFVSAVMDVDYSPTGREFVAGAYDRSIRIFAYNGGHSREVYTTKRMQRVFCVRFSGDASYVFSGSDDMNVRVWKVSDSCPFCQRLRVLGLGFFNDGKCQNLIELHPVDTEVVRRGWSLQIYLKNVHQERP